MNTLSYVPAALLAGLLAGCGRHQAPTSPSAPPLRPVQVRVAAVRSETAPSLTVVTGTIRSIQRAQLASKLMGAIEALPVALGQRVSRGDELARIGAGEVMARVAQAKSQLNAAQRDLERERSLLGKGASTTETVKGLEDRRAGVEAMLREAEVMLGYASVRAPFDGIVTRKLANAGDLASPGLPLLEIEGATGFEVEAGVPDSLAPALAVGAPLIVELPAIGLTLTGTLAELSPAADATARTVPIKLTLPDHRGVRSGQFARIQVPGAASSALLAPAAAISPVGQMERVFVAPAGDRAVLRLVKTGARRGDNVEILSGLDDGERVVVGPPAGLREGQPLQIQP